MKKVKNILGLDWWTKYIGVAYINQGARNLVMPIGYLQNWPELLFELASIITRYNISKIIIWLPKDEKIKEKVKDFIDQLKLSFPEIEILPWDEEYSSVEAKSKLGDYQKNMWKDTISAMVILERYLESLNDKNT